MEKSWDFLNVVLFISFSGNNLKEIKGDDLSSRKEDRSEWAEVITVLYR